MTRGNGTSEAAAFDGASRLTQLVQNLTGTGDDLTLDFTHDATGGIVSRDLSNSAYDWNPLSAGTTAYADNGLKQYTNVGGTSQSYDGRGNLTTGSYSYDIFNRLIAGPSSFTAAYDPSGRLYETTGKWMRGATSFARATLSSSSSFLGSAVWSLTDSITKMRWMASRSPARAMAKFG